LLESCKEVGGGGSVRKEFRKDFYGATCDIGGGIFEIVESAKGLQERSEGAGLLLEGSPDVAEENQ